MSNLFRNLKSFATLALASAAFCLSASAADWDHKVLVAPNTLTITNGATSNYTAVVNVRGADYVAIQKTIQLNGAGTDGCIFKFKKSVDGAAFETTPSVLLTNAAAGTTATTYVDLVDVRGVRDLMLSSVVNGVSGQAITNFAVVVGIKNLR